MQQCMYACSGMCACAAVHVCVQQGVCVAARVCVQQCMCACSRTYTCEAARACSSACVCISTCVCSSACACSSVRVHARFHRHAALRAHAMCVPAAVQHQCQQGSVQAEAVLAAQGTRSPQVPQGCAGGGPSATRTVGAPCSVHLPKCVKRFFATCSRAWGDTEGTYRSLEGQGDTQRTPPPGDKAGGHGKDV